MTLYYEIKSKNFHKKYKNIDKIEYYSNHLKLIYKKQDGTEICGYIYIDYLDDNFTIIND